VLIEGRDDGSIRLMATDLDLRVERKRPGQRNQAGATTVSAHTLFDMFASFRKAAGRTFGGERQDAVNAGRSPSSLSTLPRDDFPVIAEGDLPSRFELPATTLRQIIDKTVSRSR
jgi:DNA polymerase-3 subunit beta